MAQGDLHSLVVERLLERAQQTHGLNVFIEKQPVGTFIRQHGGRVKVNFRGKTDVGGAVTGGRWFQIEVKTGSARPNKDQRAWRDRCKQLRIAHMILHVDEASSLDAQVDEAVRWIGELMVVRT